MEQEQLTGYARLKKKATFLKDHSMFAYYQEERVPDHHYGGVPFPTRGVPDVRTWEIFQ